MIVRRCRWLAMACVAAGSLFSGSAGLRGDGVPAPGADQAAALRANRLLADRVVNLVFARTRDTGASPQRIAQETMVLLQQAAKLDPDNVHVLKLLVEAARTAGAAGGGAEVQKDALRKIISLDHGDMVSLVAYLDLMASSSQVLEERAKVYQAAFESTKLDPQVRSQMGVRLARLSAERGEVEAARKYLQQALALNDVNVEALKEMLRLSDRAPAAQLKGVVGILSVNPYEPAVWLKGAGVLGSTGVHDRAADALVVGLEQMSMSGEQAGGELYLQLGMEYAAAGRTAEAYPILSTLSKLPDAPLSAMMAAELLSTEYAGPVPTPSGMTAPGDATTAPATAPAGDEAPAPVTSAPAPPEPLPVKILKRLTAAIAADPKSAGALADGVWVELSALPEVAPETGQWLKTYAGMAPADDTVLPRLQGWQLLRDGKLAEAEGALAKLSASDPLAQLGLARALLEQKKIPEAGKQLQDLWSSHPTGLLAFQVAQMARVAHITLTGTELSKQMIEIWNTLPSRTATAHREPRDQELVSVSLPPKEFALGDPVVISVRLTNTTDHAVPVGPDGVVKTTLGLTAGTRGMEARYFGMYAVEDLQRVYRLERRGAIDATVRADAGLLGDIFQLNPTQTMTVGLGVIIAPRGSLQSPLPGLGGQQVNLPDFDRTGTPLKVDSITRLVRDAASLPLDKQMLRAELAGALVLALPKGSGEAALDPKENQDREAMNVLRVSVLSLVQDMVKSPSPVMRAWMLQVLPIGGLNEPTQSGLDAMQTDADPVVRMMWVMRVAAISRRAPGIREQILADIDKAVARENDPAIKKWMTMTLEDERARKPEKPATAGPAEGGK